MMKELTAQPLQRDFRSAKQELATSGARIARAAGG
jgi:hypothetical protein